MVELTPNCDFCDPIAGEVKAVFNFLAPEEVAQLCPFLELKEWPAEALVMQENDPENYLGFVVEGRLAVKKETSFKGKYIVIAILDQGTMVGEGAFVEDGTRSSTVVALEDTKMLILTVKRMELLIEKSPGLAIKLMKRILHIISLRLRKAGDRISELL